MQIYGRANVDFSSYSATGAVTASDNLVARNRVADSGSRFGLRVNEDLGQGRRAFVVCETGINIDNGGFAGQGVGLLANGTTTASGASVGGANQNTSANTFCSREGHVGLGNSMAEVRLGRQNIWWTHGEVNQTGPNFLSADVLGAMYAPSAGLSSAPLARTSNVALLHAGRDFGAFAGSQLYYVVDRQEAILGATPGTTSHGPNKGNASGIKLNYSKGNIVAMLDYAKVNNFTNDVTAASNFDASGTKAGVGYKYSPGSLVSFTYWKLDRTYTLSTAHDDAPTNVNLGTGATGSRAQSGWGINLQHALDKQIDLYAQYGKMGNAKNYLNTAIANSGVTGIMVGARYKLSPRTAIHATYAQLKNGAANAVNFAAGSYASGNSGLGADPKIMAVGIMHNF